MTVWSRASICSSVSRSSLSSTICRRKENPPGVTMGPHRQGPAHVVPGPGPAPQHRAQGLAPELPGVSRSFPSWLHGSEKPAQIPG